MTESIEPKWLTVPELMQILGESPGRIHRLIDDRRLLGRRIDGVLKIPAEFIKDAFPLPELHGTAVVLHDAGFTDDEAVEWLLSKEENLGTTPISALRAGRKAEVRRIAQALA